MVFWDRQTGLTVRVASSAPDPERPVERMVTEEAALGADADADLRVEMLVAS